MTAGENFDRWLAVLAREWGDQADSAHDLAHVARVWANVRLIAAAEGGDLAVLAPATALHDLVNLPKDAPDREQASARSAARASDLLAAAGLARTRIAAIGHAIAAHSHSAGIAPRSAEARVLRDADRLDALGAVGLARVMAVSGALGRALYDPDDPWGERRRPDDSRWAVDHFTVKLLRLEAGMLTATGRAMAAERSAILRRYLRDLGAEIGTPWPGA